MTPSTSLAGDFAPSEAAPAQTARRSPPPAGLVAMAQFGAVAVPLGLGLAAGAPALLRALPLVAARWLVTAASAKRAARRSRVAIGGLAAAFLITLGGFLPVLTLAVWLPGPSFPELLLLAVAAFALAASVHEILSRRLRDRDRVLVVGRTEEAVDLLDDLALNPEVPFDCVGVVTDEPHLEKVAGASVLGPVGALREIVSRDRPDLVIFADTATRDEAVSRVVDAEVPDVRIASLADFYEHAFGRVPLRHLPPTWFMSVFHLYQQPYSRTTKRILDIGTASLALLLTAPLLLVLAVFVRCSGPGPVLFRQVRLGESGTHFVIVKFRTMVPSAEGDGEAQWASAEDMRVTSVGRFLRRTRLDELPQLWNVLRGEMSIVGPRPERPEFLQLLQSEVPYWTRRHLIKPGITGWAQLRSGYAADVDSTAEKLSHDLYYLRHRSLLLDLVIMAKTAKTLVSSSGSQPISTSSSPTGIDCPQTVGRSEAG